MNTSYLTDVIAGLEARVAQLRELEAALAKVDNPNIIILGVRLDTDSLPNGVELVTSGDVRAEVCRARDRWFTRGGRGSNWFEHLPIARALRVVGIEGHDGGAADAAVARAIEWLASQGAS